MNKIFIDKRFCLLMCFLLLPVIAYSQSEKMVTEVVKSDTLKTGKNPGDSIIISSVADPYVYYDPYGEAYRVQSGLYTGGKHLGFESTYLHPGSPYYVNLFMGVASFRDLQTPSSSVWIGGLSMGREFFLTNRRQFADDYRTDFYFRIGPGIGFSGRGIFDGRSADYYVGFFQNAILGAQFNFSTRTSLYVHGGGRMLWFPALDEVGFSVLPLLSIGLQFSSSPQVPMVRF